MHKPSRNSSGRMLYPTDLSAPGAVEALIAAHRATFGGFVMEATEFVIPEDVSSVEDLEAAVTEALAEADRIGENEDALTDAELDRLDALAAFVESAREEAARRETEAEERRQRAEAARARMRGEDSGDEDGTQEGDQAGAEDGGDQDGAEVGSQEEQGAGEAETRQPEAVAADAGVRRRRAPGLVRRVRQPENPTPAQAAASGITITAAAGIRDVEPGSRLPDLDALTRAFMQRLSGFPKGHVPGQFIKNPVATLSVGGWGDLDQANRRTYEDDQQLIAAAGDPHRQAIQDAGGLIAAGWCAPSETLYDWLTPFTTDGLFQIGEFRVTRGGVNTTLGPDFAALWADANSGFAQTEAQAEARTPKPCITVSCPPFTETRLDAVGYCVKAGILQETAYPELIRDFLAAVAVGHQMRISARSIASIVSKLPAAATVPASGSAARSMLTALELASEGERQKYALGDNDALEVVLPRWVRVVLRDDLAARNGVGLDRVTDAVLDGHFADRGVRVQWVRGWQALTIPATGVVDFPDAVNAIMYPAGTFARGRADVISLDAVYDTTDLTTNEFTAAFFEEAMLILRRGRGGVNLRVPLVSRGSTGPQDLVAYGVADA